MRKKNGFTVVELLAVITLLGVLSMIVIGATTKFFTQSEEKVYQEFESTMKAATENYLIEHSDMIPDKGSTNQITLDTLIDAQYSDRLNDPEDKGNVCDGYVIVENKGEKGLNLDLGYQVCLKCSRYQSDECQP